MSPRPKKRCSYCGIEGSLSREHIWPDWLHEATDYKLNFSMSSGKTTKSPMVIKDVCEPCNNGVLGRLDDAAKAIYLRHFQHWVAAGEEVRFEYDHGRLLRWLLKVSFNSARTTGIDAGILGRYRQVIACEHAVTPLNAFAVVRTVRPSWTTKNGLIVPMQPRGARCGRIVLPGQPDPRFVARVISVNAYFFSIFLLDDDTMPPEEFASLIYSYGVPLMPTGASIIPPPTMDTRAAMGGIEKWPPLRADVQARS